MPTNESSFFLNVFALQEMHAIKLDKTSDKLTCRFLICYWIDLLSLGLT